MTSPTYLEQALTRYQRASERLLHADEHDFDRCLEEFVRELRENALASTVVRALPPSKAQAWWIETLERAESSYAPASLEFPDGEDDRLALFADLLASMTAETGCTVQEFGTVLHCYKRDASVAVFQELVVQPFCELLKTRLREARVVEASSSRAGGRAALEPRSAEQAQRN